MCLSKENQQNVNSKDKERIFIEYDGVFIFKTKKDTDQDKEQNTLFKNMPLDKCLLLS